MSLRRILLILLACPCFLASKAQESGASLLKEGLFHYFNRDYQQALPLLLSAAEQRNPVAHYYIGQMYEHGRAVGKNVREAFGWYLKAAELGDEDAQHVVYLCYLDGKGVTRNLKKADQWKYRWDEAGKRKAAEYQRYK